MSKTLQLRHQIDDLTPSRCAQAQLRCEIARKQVEAGEYEEAIRTLGDLWRGVGLRPRLDGLDRAGCADLLLLSGVLSGWLGSVNHTKDAQEKAKNLIGQSFTLFESLSSAAKVFEAQIELAQCYWREGAYDEARITLHDARVRFGDTDRRLKALALVREAEYERSSAHLHEALNLLAEAAVLVETSQNHALKGIFHNTRALVYRNLSEREDREQNIDRALTDYAGASIHFDQAGHTRYQARVENNLGFLFFKISKFEEAHKHLDNAHRLFTHLKDGGSRAQVDETRAGILLAQGRNAEAEKAAREAVRRLEQGDQLALLAEALTTHAVALARTGHHNYSRLTFERAIETAHKVGDMRGRGLAALTMIEECVRSLDQDDLLRYFRIAEESLAGSQNPKLYERLRQCARLAFASLDADSIAARVEALNEQAWEMRRRDARAALELSRQAHQLAGSILHRRGEAYALRTSSACLMLQGEHEQALSDASQSLRLFEELQDRAGQADALTYLGNAAARLGDYQQCIDCNLRGYHLRESLDDKLGQSFSLNSVGLAHQHLCEYSTALEYYLRSLRLKEEAGDRQHMAVTLNNIAIIYEKLSDYPRALEHLFRALEINLEEGGQQIEGLILANIGGIYCLQEDYENALTYHLRGLQSAQGVGDKRGEAASLSSIGSDYAGLGEDVRALEYYFRGLEITPREPHFESETLIKLAQIYIKRGGYDLAIEHLSRALAIGGGLAHPELIYRAHEGLSQAYELQGNASEALGHYKAFFKWRKKVLGEEAERKVHGVMTQAVIERSQQETEIYRLKNVELAAAHQALEEGHEEKSKLVEELRQQAEVLERQNREDGLTGLLNRRHLNDRLPREFDRARRFGHDLSVVMCDIDHFKRVNDQFSHRVGDEVIKRVASILRDHCRGVDLVARYGGEEFTLVLVETSPANAAGVCERIRREVEAYDWGQIHPELRVTLSMGVVGIEPFTDAEMLLAAADRKLYEAKHLGRNQVRV